MSLPRRERRALREIEAGITRSDPVLARMLSGFHGVAGGEAMPAAERGPGAAARARAGALAVAVPTARLIVRGIAAVAEGGVRERLGVRMRPQPTARSQWQRLT
ncbi:MAG: DUF3040 domain-containing protein [Streptosporangiaceae bacterium]